MRISQNTELVLVVVLVLYTAFTPGFPAVRQFLSTGVGKAVGLGAIVAVWKYVSPLAALLLTVDFIRCATLREYMENPPMEPHCPADYTLENGQCKGKSGQSIPATICTKEKPVWDGDKCVATTAPATAPPMTTPTPPPSSSETKQHFTAMTPGGVQPSEKETEHFSPV